MIVKVFPRNVIETILEKSLKLFSKWALISINEPNEKLIDSGNEKKLKELYCESVLSLDFSDLTLEQYEIVKNSKDKFSQEQKLFSNEQSKLIIDFVKKIKNNRDLDYLIVHCAAGISRSGAVGLWANRYLGLKEGDFWVQNPCVYPNRYVLDLLTKMSGINTDYKKVWENVKVNDKFKDLFIN